MTVAQPWYTVCSWLGLDKPLPVQVWTGQRVQELPILTTRLDFPIVLALELQSCLVAAEARTLWSRVSGAEPERRCLWGCCLESPPQPPPPCSGQSPWPGAQQ